MTRQMEQHCEVGNPIILLGHLSRGDIPPNVEVCLSTHIGPIWLHGLRFLSLSSQGYYEQAKLESMVRLRKKFMTRFSPE